MAANRFTIPQFDIDLLNWSNNVNARNDARARQRQQDWNNVYSQAAALGNRIRAENEAEKARKFQAAENALQRQHQEQMQAAQIAAQQDNLKFQKDIERGKNTRRADAEANLIKAKLNKDLSVGGLKEADKQYLIDEAQAALEANYARYGVDAPEFNLNATPYKPVSVDTQALAQTTPSEDITADNSVDVPPLGKTASQEKYDLEQTKKGFETRKEQIRQMENGDKKADAMLKLNEDSQGLVTGFTTEDIKKARYIAPAYRKYQILLTEAQADDARNKGFDVGELPDGTWKVYGKRGK